MGRRLSLVVCLTMVLGSLVASNKVVAQQPTAPWSYGSVEAGQEAYAQAEAARQATISVQVGAQQRIAVFAAWPPLPPFIPRPAAMYVPGAYLPRRAVWAYRGPFPLPVPVPYPFQYAGPPGYVPSWSTLGPGGLHPHPYAGGVPQPIPEAAAPASPNGYTAPPGYPSHFQPQMPPEAPSPSPSDQGPQLTPPSNAAPSAMPSILEPPAASMPRLPPPGAKPVPETIPTPPAETNR